MKYIEKDTDYRLRITVESKEISIDPSVIKDELVGISDRIEPCYKSSRSMWPEQELIGVSINESQMFSGKITRDKIKLSINNYVDFDNVYEDLKNWLVDTKIDLPNKQTFRVTGFTFCSTEEDKIVVSDSTKSIKKDELFGNIHEYNNMRSNYSMIQGMVTFSIIDPENGMLISDFENYIDAIIDQNIIVVGDIDNITELPN